MQAKPGTTEPLQDTLPLTGHEAIARAALMARCP